MSISAEQIYSFSPQDNFWFLESPELYEEVCSQISERKPIIVLLGPALAGKGETGKALSDLLEIPILETGMSFRAATWLVQRDFDSLDQFLQLDLPEREAYINRFAIELIPGAAIDGGCGVVIRDLKEGKDVLFSDRPKDEVEVLLSPPNLESVTEVLGIDVLNSNAISRVIPSISGLPEVRQRVSSSWVEIAEKNGAIIEGRGDMLKLFPGNKSDIKVFLTASLDELGRRERLRAFMVDGERITVLEGVERVQKRNKHDHDRPLELGRLPTNQEARESEIDVMIYTTEETMLPDDPPAIIILELAEKYGITLRDLK